MRFRQAKQIGFLSLVILLLCGLLSCSPVSEGGDDTLGESGAATLAISTNSFTIKSNGEDVASITATVLDENNAAMEGVTVLFSTDSGQLSGSTAVTDESGAATVLVSAGSIDRSNRTITVTAQVVGLDNESTVIQVTGTTITASVTPTSVQTSTDDTATLSVVVKDANGVAIPNVPVEVTTNATKSSGSVTPSNDLGQTGADSSAYTLELQGGSPGDVVLTIAAAGVTVDTDAFDGTITVGGSAPGEAFGITQPTADPATLETGDDLVSTTADQLEIIVNAPTQDQILFSTTLGGFWNSASSTWDSYYTADVSGGTAQATMRSTSAGMATVQVTDADEFSPSDSITVAVAAPSTSAARISLQGSASVVAPSVGDVKNSISLEATVTNSGDEPVGEATVLFSIENSTGTGEYITPVVRKTNGLGAAEVTFTSGLEGSDPSGVKVWAEVVNSSPPIRDDFDVVIGGEPGSVMIGRGTTIESIQNDTAYRQPMAVVVADANGNPVAGAQVSLSSWPAVYYDGYWVKVGEEYIPVIIAGAHNEDVNENLRKDPTEDDFTFGNWECYTLDSSGTNNDPFITTANGGGNGDEILTPPNSSAGTLEDTVTTDENGTAQFNLVYAKASAVWIKARISATTTVLGTETKAELFLDLPYLEGDAGNLASSPFELYDTIESEVLRVYDRDGDNYTNELWTSCPFPGSDCNDDPAGIVGSDGETYTGADIYPGAAESCNGLDDNCNDEIDEGCRPFYRDADFDGYGDPSVSVIDTSAPFGYVANDDDCDDTDNDVYPGQGC